MGLIKERQKLKLNNVQIKDVRVCFILNPKKPNKEFPIPVFENPKQYKFKFIRVKNGKITFHLSDTPLNDGKYISLDHGHFWQIPKGAIHFSFPNVKLTMGGWHYSEPVWCYSG